jgi:1,4-alpha-glucan branching enzyme
VTEELNGDGSGDYLLGLGATALQLLPLNEFAGDVSWGYNPSFFYAIESSYGTPDQLKALVDTAHQKGIAVVLDVVPNHGGSGDNVLWQIAQTDIRNGTYYDGDTVWGPMLNFDNDVARHFFIQNLVYLAREYHIDGFRFDFTRPIHNPSDGNIRLQGSGGGWAFLREIREQLIVKECRSSEREASTRSEMPAAAALSSRSPPACGPRCFRARRRPRECRGGRRRRGG